MNIKIYVIPAILLALALPGAVSAKAKRKHAERGMLEKMEAVPCGARERGLTGLGSVFGSAGIEHVNSDEKLCPQYLLRTDEMEYHIRPTDGKHPVVLPIGKEGEFKIKKDRMFLKVPDGDRKTRTYQVVAMKPVNTGENTGEEAAKPVNKPNSDRLADSVPKPQVRTDPANPANSTPPVTPAPLVPPPNSTDPPHL
jgi:hypothetical protein